MITGECPRVGILGNLPGLGARRARNLEAPPEFCREFSERDGGCLRGEARYVESVPGQRWRTASNRGREFVYGER